MIIRVTPVTFYVVAARPCMSLRRRVTPNFAAGWSGPCSPLHTKTPWSLLGPGRHHYVA
jgi:hypothetical protein